MSDNSKEKLGRDIEDIEMENIIQDYMDDTDDTDKKEEKPSKKVLPFKKKTKTGITDKDIKESLRAKKTAENKKRNVKKIIGRPGKKEYKQLAKAHEVKLDKAVMRSNNPKRDQVFSYVIMGSKIALSIVILLFVVAMFNSWFTVTGEGAKEGFIRVEEKIQPNMEKEVLAFGNGSGTITRVADFSPIRLIGFALQFRESYKVSIDSEGVEGISTFARLHLFIIYLFILSVVGALVSIVLLIIGKDYQFAHIVRSIGFMSLFALIINAIALKVPFFSMIALRVQTILNVQNPEEAARMTNLGIVSGDQLYEYGMSFLPAAKFAFILLIIWVLTAAIMGEIGNRMDDHIRMTTVEEE